MDVNVEQAGSDKQSCGINHLFGSRAAAVGNGNNFAVDYTNIHWPIDRVPGINNMPTTHEHVIVAVYRRRLSSGAWEPRHQQELEHPPLEKFHLLPDVRLMSG